MNNENQTANPLDDFLDEDTFTENPFSQPNGQDFDPFAAAPASMQNGQTAGAAQVPAEPPAQQVIPPSQPVAPPVAAPESVVQNQTPAPALAVQAQLSFSAEPATESPKTETVQQSTNPLAAALQNAQANADQKIIETFSAKPPQFSYAKVKEDITDAEKTFDNLREQYETDFPELSEKKSVSWTVTYGKVTKPILKPEADKVYEIKTEIEKSKAFLDGIKKAKTDKEREPQCLVTPKVIAKSKGEAIASYKGIFPTLDAAMKENKPIMLVPGRDGKVYEIRCNDIGRFITPAASPPELSWIEPGFNFHLPKIPYQILYIIINFFKYFALKNLEVLAHILFDKETNVYQIHIPNQKISPSRVAVDLKDTEQNDNIIHVMDIHSHHNMPAEFSIVDDRDEKATGIYAVVGKLCSLFPQINVRISNGGKFYEIKPENVFELKNNFSECDTMKSDIRVSEMVDYYTSENIIKTF